MRRTVWLVAAIALLVAMAGLSGCGDSQEQAKADLKVALDKVEASVSGFQQMGASSTVADIKAARDAVAPDWDAVVTAAKGVEGADVAAAEKAWADLDAAVNSIPDDASIMQAAGLIIGPVQTLLQVEGELRQLVEAS